MDNVWEKLHNFAEQSTASSECQKLASCDPCNQPTQSGLAETGLWELIWRPQLKYSQLLFQ